MKTDNMKPIAMRCTREQFESIRPRLERFGCKIVSIGDFRVYGYLINDSAADLVLVSNINKCGAIYHNRTVYETFDADLFCAYCGEGSAIFTKYTLAAYEKLTDSEKRGLTDYVVVHKSQVVNN